MTPDTIPYGYLFDESADPSRFRQISEMMPEGTLLVPLKTRRQFLESAIHNVATGLFEAILVDPSLETLAYDYVGARSLAAEELARVDCITSRRGALMGDMIAYNALCAVLNPRVPPSGELMGGVIGTGRDSLVCLYYLMRICSYVQVVGEEITDEMDCIIPPTVGVGLVSPGDFLPQVCDVIAPCNPDVAAVGTCPLRVSFDRYDMEVGPVELWRAYVEEFMKKVSEAR